jgi:hypothetical protein
LDDYYNDEYYLYDDGYYVYKIPTRQYTWWPWY